MGKGIDISGRMRGRVGQRVYSVTKGEQIVRTYNAAPANPQTGSQMETRVMFANLAKFYSHSQKARFPFAFQNKTQKQTDYNAFMKANMDAGIVPYLTKTQLADPYMPIVAPFIVTEGSLAPAPMLAPVDDYQDLMVIDLNFGNVDSEGTVLWYDSWQQVIDANPSANLQMGDILTVTLIINDAKWYEDGSVAPGTYAPIWKTWQIKIGQDLGELTLKEYMVARGFMADLFASSDNEVVYRYCPALDVAGLLGVSSLSLADSDISLCWGTVATRSRFEGGKTTVSASKVRLGAIAQRIFEVISGDAQLALAVESYRNVAPESEPTELLQGEQTDSFIKQPTRVKLLANPAYGVPEDSDFYTVPHDFVLPKVGTDRGHYNIRFEGCDNVTKNDITADSGSGYDGSITYGSGKWAVSMFKSYKVHGIKQIYCNGVKIGSITIVEH